MMPILGYAMQLELASAEARTREGLGPRARPPDLDDVKARDDLRYGRRVPVNFHIVLGTSSDQVPVASGTLVRDWTEGERRYVEYRTPQPVMPVLSFASARYEVARDWWKGVAIEVYYDPKHAEGVPTLLRTAKRGLDYYTREFGAYPLRDLRIFEYPRYRTFSRPYVGTLS